MDSHNAARIGVYGGTFDPIHLGHLIVAEEMTHRLKLDVVLFVPTGRPPHKTGQTISPDRDRVEMVKLAIRNNPNFRLSTVDVDRPELSYTAETLRILSCQFPESELYFIMGEDSLRDLPTWHEPNRIARQAMLAVALRPEVVVDIDDVLEAVPDARDRIVTVNMPLIEISSSDIRRRVAHSEPITYHVPDSVKDYIDASGLYR